MVIQNPDTNINFSNTISIYSDSELDSIFSVGSEIGFIGYNNFNVYSTVKYINTIDSKLILDDYVQYKFPNVFSGYTQANTVVISKYNNTGSNASMGIGDDISIGNNIITIENIDTSNNILYFPISLESTGSELHTANVSIIKKLTSNNIIKYTTV